MSSNEPIQLISSADATSNLTSVPLDIGDEKVYSIQADFTGGGGDLVGTLKLQASVDGSTYVDVTDSDQAVAASADHLWSVTDAGYRYVRVDWAFTSGTGNLTVKAIIKGTPVKGA